MATVRRARTWPLASVRWPTLRTRKSCSLRRITVEAAVVRGPAEPSARVVLSPGASALSVASQVPSVVALPDSAASAASAA